jgi:hypothetical protein
MKRKYIKPTTKVFASIEVPIMAIISGGVNNFGQCDNGGVCARGTDFMEDESEDNEDNAMGYRRYNLWEE